MTMCFLDPTQSGPRRAGERRLSRQRLRLTEATLTEIPETKERRDISRLRPGWTSGVARARFGQGKAIHAEQRFRHAVDFRQ